MQTLTMKCVTNDRRGAGSSTYFIGADIGYLIGPTIAGFIAQTFGYRTMWHIMAIPMLFAIALVYLTRFKIAKIEGDFIEREQQT
jgi:MFS family permease